jgi:hypothetical protein
MLMDARDQHLRDRISGLKSGGFLAHRNHQGVEMRQNFENKKPSSDGLSGEHSIAELCRREGIAESLYSN